MRGLRTLGRLVNGLDSVLLEDRLATTSVTTPESVYSGS